MNPAYNWKQVAGSNTIVKCLLNANELCDKNVQKNEYADVFVIDPEIIGKGKHDKVITIKVWANDSYVKSVCEYNGKDVIAFLNIENNGYASFINSDSVRLKLYDKEDITKIEHEIKRQDLISEIDLKELYEGRIEWGIVKKMYDSLFINVDHYDLYKRIIKHDKALSPYFAMLLSMDKKLLEQHIEYPIDNPNHFESIAHYRIETSTDLMSISLGYVNKIHFNELLYNPTHQKRLHEARAWKIWAYENYFNAKNEKLPNNR
jgi:hypothetical protein